MDFPPILTTFAAAIVAATFFGWAAVRIGLSPLIGYLLAGLALGPATGGISASPEIAKPLADVGVVLLLFGVGLHFNIGDLIAVGRLAAPGALITAAVVGTAAYLIGRAFGLPGVGAAAFALCLLDASTVVMSKLMTEEGEQSSKLGRTAVGWVVMEDLLAIIFLAILPGLGGGLGGGAGQLVVGILWAMLKLVLLFVLARFVIQHIIVWLLSTVVRTHSRELFTLMVLSIALIIALGSAAVFGASMELGALLAGMVVGQSTYVARAAADALPMRDAFAALFFISVGMLLSPTVLAENWQLALAVLVILSVIKPIVVFVAAKLLRQSPNMVYGLAGSVSQTAEFAFIMASVAVANGLFGDAAQAAAVQGAIVSGAILSVALNKPLFLFMRKLGAARAAAAAAPDNGDMAPVRPDEVAAVVVGHGPVGEVVTTMLRQAGLGSVVIDLNPTTVEQLNSAGQPAVYGDVAQPGILEHAGAQHAGALFFTADIAPNAEAIAFAHELNPNLHVLARARYTADVDTWREAGADQVVVSEVEVALAMIEHLLVRLGASPEAIDHERDRVRAKLCPITRDKAAAAD